MSIERYGWQEQRVSTDRLIEVTGNINDFVDEPVSPLVEEFARVLGSPWAAMREANGVAWAASPGEMRTNSYNLLQLIGSNGQEQTHLLRYLPPNLLEISDAQLAELFYAVPIIMRASYPRDFADAFAKEWEGLLKHWGYKEDLPNHTVDELEPILATITTATAAKRLIIDDAKANVLALDWEWALGDEVSEQEISSWFDRMYPGILCSNIAAPVLTVYDRQRDDDAFWQLPPHQKLRLDERQTLAMLLDDIGPQDATFLRDCLCLFVADMIGTRYHTDDAGARLVMTNPGLHQATNRNWAYFGMSDDRHRQ